MHEKDWYAAFVRSLSADEARALADRVAGMSRNESADRHGWTADEVRFLLLVVQEKWDHWSGDEG